MPLECNLESLARQEEKGSSGVDYWTPVMMASHGATSLTVESRSIVSKQLVRHSQSTEKRQDLVRVCTTIDRKYGCLRS